MLGRLEVTEWLEKETGEWDGDWDEGLGRITLQLAMLGDL